MQSFSNLGGEMKSNFFALGSIGLILVAVALVGCGPANPEAAAVAVLSHRYIAIVPMSATAVLADHASYRRTELALT